MISIVVCTFNGSARITACLSALIAQEKAPEYEILIVDNASTDQTGETVNNYLSSEFSFESWRVIQEEKPGLLFARLAGLRAAKYDWVLFCDDDNILFRDFLFQAQIILSQKSRTGVLGSHGFPEFLGPKPDWFDSYSSSFAVGSQQVEDLPTSKLVHVYGAGSLYFKKPLLSLFEKGFSPALSDRSGNSMISGGDVEWCWLMQFLGFRVIYSSKLRFYHQISASRLTWDYFLQLKRGISSSAGLLSTYKIFHSHPQQSSLTFSINYWKKLLQALLIYVKYFIRWKGHPSRPADQLSFTILEAQMKTYVQQRSTARSHFRQLKQYFGS